MSQAEGYTIDSLVAQIASDHPDLEFVEGGRFAWHAGNSGRGRISYRKVRPNNKADTTSAIFSLFHELGHALLGHKDYTNDMQLLQMEAAAWSHARGLAGRYNVTLDEDHVQDCLDTYRDWLHLRATCPTCYARSLQQDARNYRCHNCGTQWSVTRSRLCRPYRLRASGSPAV